MELMNAIYGRRAIRHFTNRDVPREVIAALAEAAAQAPSAMNSQSWAFAVFKGRERLQDFSERAKLYFQESFSPGSADPDVRMREILTKPGYNIFHDATTLVVVYAKPNHDRFAVGACYLAAQNLMLSAFDMGLGTCPIGFAQPWLDLDEIKAELGIPVQYTAVFPLVVGYPEGPAEDPHRHRPEFLN
jgi:nitroreductase